MIVKYKNEWKTKLLKNKNFLNNQNYITEKTSIKLLNYYAFNNRGKRIISSSYWNMEKYLNKKLKDFFIISILLGVFYILKFVWPPFLFFFWFIGIFYILNIYSFVFFLFNNKRYTYKYYLDKNIYIIDRKYSGYNFDYLNWLIKVSYDKNEK